MILLVILILSFVDMTIPYFIYLYFTDTHIHYTELWIYFLISLLLHGFQLYFMFIQLIILITMIIKNRKNLMEFHVSSSHMILLFIAFHLFTYLICHVIISSLLDIPFTIEELFNFNIYSTIVYEFILSLLLMTILNMKLVTDIKMQFIRTKLYITVILVSVGLCLLLTQIYFDEIILSPSLIYSFLGGLFLYLVFIIFSFFKEVLESEREKEKINEAYKINKVKLEGYIEIQKHFDEFQKYKHDIKNNLQTLQYLQKNHQDKAQDYLNNLIGRLTDIHTYPQICIHPIVNAILINKIKENQTVLFDIKCSISDCIYIDDVDINILLANLIDNALEYLKSNPIKDKKIDVKFIEHGNMYLLSVANPVLDGFQYDKNILTTKKDKVNHGYGMSIIKSVVLKYNGEINFDLREHSFEINILLKE